MTAEALSLARNNRWVISQWSSTSDSITAGPAQQTNELFPGSVSNELDELVVVPMTFFRVRCRPLSSRLGLVELGLAVCPGWNLFFGVSFRLAALPMALIPDVLGDATLILSAYSAAGGIDAGIVAPVHRSSFYGALMGERHHPTQREVVIAHIHKL